MDETAQPSRKIEPFAPILITSGIPWGYGLMIASIVPIFFGMWFIYNGNESSVRLVGGDAYNYIIAAGRGTAWVGVGVAMAVMGAALSIIRAIWIAVIRIEDAQK